MLALALVLLLTLAPRSASRSAPCCLASGWEQHSRWDQQPSTVSASVSLWLLPWLGL
jgi:hypothetical protein